MDGISRSAKALASAAAKGGIAFAGKAMLIGAKATRFVLKIGGNIILSSAETLCRHFLERLSPGVILGALDATTPLSQSIGKIEADWTTVESGGIERAWENPHVVMTLPPGTVKVTLKRTDGKKDCGMFLAIFGMPLPAGCRFLTKELYRSVKPLVKSSYNIDSSVACALKAEHGGQFLMVPVLQHGGALGPFTIEVVGVPQTTLTLLPALQTHRVSGGWDGAVCEGPQSAQNAQAEFVAGEKQQLMISVDFGAANQDEGHQIKLFPGEQAGRRNAKMQGLIVESGYNRGRFAELCAVVERGRYIAVVSREKVRTVGTWAMEARTTGRLDLVVLPHVEEPSHGVVTGRWSEVESGGMVDPSENPHVRARLHGSSCVDIIVRRTDKGSMVGLKLDAFSVSPDRDEVYLKNAQTPVSQSSYTIASTATCRVDLRRGLREVVLVPKLTTKGTTGSFTIEADPPTAATLELVPPPHVQELEGIWDEESGSAHSICNPQVELVVAKRAQVLMRCEFDSCEGHKVTLIHGGNTSCVKLAPMNLQRVLAESDYIDGNTIHLSHVLDEGRYVIVVGRQRASRTWKLAIRSGNRGLVEATVLRKRSRKMSSLVVQRVGRALLQQNFAHSMGKEDALGRSHSVFVDHGHDLVSRIQQVCAEKGGMFFDEDFPANDANLGDEVSPHRWHEPTPPTWKRVDEFCDDPCLFGDLGCIEQDMVQGRLSNCWFVSAISAVAKADRNIITRAFVPEQRTADGLFGVKVFWEGFERMVVVDDFVPTHDGCPLFARAKDPNVVWPLIVEKAFAKISGGYHKLRGDHPECLGFLAVMRLLIGCEPERTVVEANQADRVKTALRRYADTNCVVVAECGNASQGLVANHAYSVFSLQTVNIKEKQHDIVLMRNPWGIQVWQGDWGPSSARWTQETLEQVPQTGDGEFFICIEDFCSHFACVQACPTHTEMSHAKTHGSSWTGPCAGGKGSNANPHIDICPRGTLPHEGAKIFVQLQLSNHLARKNAGIWLCVCKLPVKTDSFGRISKESTVAQSSFVVSQTAQVELQMTSGTQYVIVPAVGGPQDHLCGKFVLHARATVPFELHERAVA